MLIVSHGLTNRIFAMRWLHWTPETFNSTANPGNAAAVVLALDRRGSGRYRLDASSLEVLGLPSHPA